MDPKTIDLLLARLTVGANQPYYSVDAWRARIGAVPNGAAFLDQLAAEWLPGDPPDPFSRKLADVCQAKMSNWNSGWPNLWAHTLRVAGYAMRLAPALNIEPGPAYALALLHDTGKFDEMRDGTPHEQIAGELAEDLLEGRYEDSIVVQISAAVSKRARSTNPFARLLFDADKLEKIGATGIIRRVSQVLDLPNALESLNRISQDLAGFPPMRLVPSQRIADAKAAFTEEFLVVAMAGLASEQG
jgi:hypothetical protein